MSNNGQTIADRIAAARHVIDGSTVNKAVIKATTHEVQGPKRKHLDYLVTLTGAPNVNLPELANQLVERTRNSSWVVVFKTLATTHHLMCYGNERFLQSCASRLCMFSLQEFQDRSAPAGYDMAVYVRRYSRYLNEKSASYRTVAYDFTRTKRKDDTSQSFKNMTTENLLKTLPILQGQIDALLEFQPNTNELSNGVINACFVLLFKDLVRLFACYNDGIINLLQKFFEMKKQQCRDGLQIYKRYLIRMEKIQSFFKVAENVGIDKGDMPDLTSAPSSLLDALQDHLNSLEGKRSGTVSPTTTVSQTEAERVIAEEKRRLDEFSRQKIVLEPKPVIVPELNSNPFAIVADNNPFNTVPVTNSIAPPRTQQTEVKSNFSLLQQPGFPMTQQPTFNMTQQSGFPLAQQNTMPMTQQVNVSTTQPNFSAVQQPIFPMQQQPSFPIQNQGFPMTQHSFPMTQPPSFPAVTITPYQHMQNQISNLNIRDSFNSSHQPQSNNPMMTNPFGNPSTPQNHNNQTYINLMD